MHPKCIVITGGVLSGIGKGTAAASIARLLKNNRKIIMIKCDGYLNVDPGTMNPIEHGEVFVLDDGGEVDMDFGHYERFLDINCKFEWNLTSGKIFNSVIEKERKGEFLGKTIQIFPHVSSEIKQWWFGVIEKEKPDVVMIEIGGTVGDIENSWFIESARQLKKEFGPENIMYIHLTYIPFLHSVGEPKTKPAQRDVALLREKGIQPDILICRSKELLPTSIKQKLSLHCDIDPDAIISGRDIETIYEIPLMFERQGLYNRIAKKFGFGPPDLEHWKTLVQNIKHPQHEITIAICGKYTLLKDSYASINEALVHAGAQTNTRVKLKWIETSDLQSNDHLQDVDGMIVPGGFGSRGTEGKILMIKYAREQKLPFLGICYGLQLAVVEFARNVCGLPEAHSTEINPETRHPVIAILPDQQDIQKKGGTMRLGAYHAVIQPGTLLASLYNTSTAVERHRHRYEVNPEHHEILTRHGMVFSGMSEDKKLAEFIELKDHPYFIATQGHNELTSRLERPNPLFLGLVKAALEYKNSHNL